jgi:hypothetical protein
VRSNEELHLFGPDLVLRKSQRVIDGDRKSWNLAYSHDGSSFLTSMDNGQGGQNLTLLDGDDLRPLYSCSYGPGMQSPTTIIGHSGASLLPDGNSILRIRRVAVQGICKPPNVIYQWKGDASYPTFVNQNRLVLSGPIRDLLLLSPQGQVVSRELLARSTTSDQYVVSSLNGTVFAIAAQTFRGGSSFFDISSHLARLSIIVFESQSGKKLCEPPILPVPMDGYDLVLNADGTLLAIRIDDNIQVFRLPVIHQEPR